MRLPSWYSIKRSIRFWWQRQTRGWDDSETWNLDATVAEFMLPRLRRYRELPHGLFVPGSYENDAEWAVGEKEQARILDEIEWFLSVHIDPGDWLISNQAERERYEAAGALFGKHFGALWS